MLGWYAGKHLYSLLSGAGLENVSRAGGGVTMTRTVRTALTKKTARPRTSESALRRKELAIMGGVFTPPSGVTG